MRFHVPFAHRNNSGRPAPLRPVYIGFDEPVSIQSRKRQKHRGPFNWSGFWGLLLALLSPLTIFMIAPLALLFSLNGMRRAPRGMAFVGLVFSGMATAVLSVMVLTAAHHRHEIASEYQARAVQAENHQLTEKTKTTMAVLLSELRDYRDQHNSRLPSLTDGMDMAIAHKDAWDNELMYIAKKDGCVVQSSGPDGKFESADDVVVQLDGKPDAWTAKSGIESSLDSATDK